MTQDQGHGTITLPADYVRAACAARVCGDRARLRVRHRHRRHRAGLGGDDTPRPVRRRHPRPRREPDLRHHRSPTTSPRPATSSKRILAVDRADIPAVTQRRTPRRPTTPAPSALRRRRHVGRAVVRSRTGSPSVLADARHALAEAEHTVESNTVERARRAAAVTAAEGDLAVIERATAPTARCSPSTRSEPTRPACTTPRRSAASPGSRSAWPARGAP